jgi:hypothetical protein
VTASNQELVNHHVQDINAKLGVNNTSYKATHVAQQVVAGKNYFFHITGEPDGKQYTATIYVNLQNVSEVSEVSHGSSAL